MTMRRMGLIAVAILSVTAMLYAAGKDADASKAELERQLNETLKARVESAQMAVDAVQAAFEAETVTLDQVVEAARQLIDAKLAIAKSVEEEIALLEKQLGLMKDRESRVEALWKVGTRGGEVKEYYTAKRERQTAEIELLKARIKAKR